MSLQVRLATDALVRQYFKGKLPFYSMRGAVVMDGEEVKGVGGVYRAGGMLAFFIDMDEDLKKHPRVLIQAARLVLPMLQRYTLVTAYVDPASDVDYAFARHFGFEPTGVVDQYGRQMARWNK